MATRVLIDTNVFLEVLLEQKNFQLCEWTLRGYKGESGLTDFALHSIGIALLGQRKAALFEVFLREVLRWNELLRLPESEYQRVITAHQTHRLGFDDAYQLAVAEYYGLEFITLDHHFESVASSSKITLLH